MKLTPGFYYAHFDGKRLWLNGIKQKDVEVTNVIRNCHKGKITVNAPATGMLEVLSNGEHAYFPNREND